MASAEKGAVCTYDAANEKLICRLPLDDDKAGMILAYDDLLSINYFGNPMSPGIYYEKAI